jgi:N-methylhydantoinase A
MVAAGVDGEPQIDAWALMRYQEQLMHSLEVAIPREHGEGSAGSRGDEPPHPPHPPKGLAGRLAGQFAQEYARRYGAAAASAFQAAEIFGLRVRARAGAGQATAAGGAQGAASREATARSEVLVFWPDAGERLTTAVYDGDQLAGGVTVSGPALVELPHTTVAVPGGAALTADRGHLHLRLPHADTAGKGAAI